MTFSFLKIFQAFAGLAIYSGTKWFIEAMSQALRQEVVDAGIKVTCIQPGDVKTELQSHSKDKQVCLKYIQKFILF